MVKRSGGNEQDGVGDSMQYMGSKASIARKLLEVMLPCRRPNQCWVEPFVGAGGMIQNVDGPRIGSDSDGYIVAFLNAVRDGWVPDPINKYLYRFIKCNKELFMPEYLAYVGYGCSFGGKWFGGFAHDSLGRNYSAIAIRSIKKQAPKLSNADFYHCEYNKLYIPPSSFIYCDPPYKNTTKYKIDFSHGLFWQWCRYMRDVGHTIFISEYTAPDDFECVFELRHKSKLHKTRIQDRNEKLFTLQ